MLANFCVKIDMASMKRGSRWLWTLICHLQDDLQLKLNKSLQFFCTFCNEVSDLFSKKSLCALDVGLVPRDLWNLSLSLFLLNVHFWFLWLLIKKKQISCALSLFIYHVVFRSHRYDIIHCYFVQKRFSWELKILGHVVTLSNLVSPVQVPSPFCISSFVLKNN